MEKNRSGRSNLIKELSVVKYNCTQQKIETHKNNKFQLWLAGDERKEIMDFFSFKGGGMLYPRYLATRHAQAIASLMFVLPQSCACDTNSESLIRYTVESAITQFYSISIFIESNVINLVTLT